MGAGGGGFWALHLGRKGIGMGGREDSDYNADKKGPGLEKRGAVPQPLL